MPGGIFSEFMSDTSQDVQIQQVDLQGILTDSTVSDTRSTDSTEHKKDWMPDVFQDFVDDFGCDTLIRDFLQHPRVWVDGRYVSREKLEQLRDEEYYHLRDVYSDCGDGNCYTSAMGLLENPKTGEYFDHRHAPGELSGEEMPYIGDLVYSGMSENKVTETMERYWSQDCKYLGKELIKLEPGTDQGNVKLEDDERLVAMMYSDFPVPDFHFMFKGDYGTWYHKPGLTAMKRTDESGQIITDPATCDRGMYDHFCGYYIVRDMA